MCQTCVQAELNRISMCIRSIASILMGTTVILLFPTLEDFCPMSCLIRSRPKDDHFSVFHDDFETCYSLFSMMWLDASLPHTARCCSWMKPPVHWMPNLSHRRRVSALPKWMFPIGVPGSSSSPCFSEPGKCRSLNTCPNMKELWDAKTINVNFIGCIL